MITTDPTRFAVTFSKGTPATPVTHPVDVPAAYCGEGPVN